MVVSLEPIAISRVVVGDSDDHLVQFRPNLDTTSKPTLRRSRGSAPEHSFLLAAGHGIEFAKVGLRDKDVILSAHNARTIVIVRDLIRSHCVLRVATIVVGMNTRSLVSPEDCE